MTQNGLSPLAHFFNDKSRDVSDRTAPAFGVAVHTTGSSEVEAAVKAKVDPLEYLAAYYLKPDSYFAHYVVGHNGEIIQVADEGEKALHIGFVNPERASYLDGSWVNKLPREIVAFWKAQWSGAKSPAHLFPGPSPNNVYIGVEMLPIVKGCGYPPMTAGLLYTAQQHHAVVELCIDIAHRQGLPVGWHQTSRLVGHEDINPIQRHTKKPPGCWDPGYLRQNKMFDFAFVRSFLRDRENGNLT